MDETKVKSTRFWLCILGVFVVLAIVGLFILHANRQTGAMVQVTQGGEVVDTFPLSTKGIHRYESSRGYNIVEVSNGKVAVIEADCPDKVCVRHGPTDQTADPIVCLPHSLVVQVIAPEDGEDQLDGVSS